MNISGFVYDVVDRYGESVFADALDRLNPRPTPPSQVVSTSLLDVPLDAVPTFSVVIPSFNYGHYLSAAVDSVLHQEGVSVQVIVVDDASTDNSKNVAAQWCIRDSRVKAICNRQNLGHVRTFNRGLTAAEGEYIVRLDADDLLSPGALLRAAKVLERFPNVGLVYGRPRHFVTPNPPPAVGRWSSTTVWNGRDWLTERCRRGVNCITTPEAVVRARIFEETGPLREELRFAQDMELWLRASALSDVARINGVDQALHRDHSSSMSAQEGSGHLTDLRERGKVFQLLFDAVDDRIGPEHGLRDVANRALAVEGLTEITHAFDRGRGQQIVLAEYQAFIGGAYKDWQDLPEAAAVCERIKDGAQSSRYRLGPHVAAARRAVKWHFEYLRWLRQGI